MQIVASLSLIACFFFLSSWSCYSFLALFFEAMIEVATSSLRSKVRLYLWRSCTFLEGLEKTNVDFMNLKVGLDRRSSVQMLEYLYW